MKYFQTPKGLSLIISIAVTILFSIAFSVFTDGFSSVFLRYSLLFFIFSFGLSYLITYYFVFKPLEEVTDDVKTYKADGKAFYNSESEDPFSDLSDQIQHWAQERKVEIEQLKKLENYRKEFLGNVSHELKTPIFNIQGYISTLLEGGIHDETINEDYLKRADKSVERMISIVEDLEAISQLETGNLELEMEKFDVVELTKEVLHAQEYRATGKGIILSFERYDQPPIAVMADRFRIRQVFTNLIVNSIKYGKDFGETKVKFIDITDKIIVEISDNGIGIDKPHLPRLFERFYRVDKGRSRDEGGTGLGLAIVKHIIEAHDQQITVTSSPGVGTTFSFTLNMAIG